MKRLIVLALFASTVAWAETPPSDGIPRVPLPFDWLARAMDATPACRVPSSPNQTSAPPGGLQIQIHFVGGAVVDATALTTSGSDAFDQRAISCMRGLPPQPPLGFENLNIVVQVYYNGGAIALRNNPYPPMMPGHTFVPAHAVGRTHNCLPFFLKHAVREGLTGMVGVAYRISKDGSIQDVTVVRSSGNKVLDDAAVACVADGWRDTPAMLDGQPIETKSEANIRLYLEPAPAPQQPPAAPK